MKLGIRLERIEPGKPYQNGRHERMHLTLKKETTLPARSSLIEQQKAFDDFRKEFNFKRPHEALKNRFPSVIYRPSKRKFPKKLNDPAYATSFEPQKVSDEGTIRHGIHRIFLSTALRDELIALEEISDRHKRVHFSAAAIAVLDIYTGKLLQYKNPKPIITKK